ncbi:MAG: hypothetical protein IJC84_04805 [Clostridia bacterium]|nr:hypothetical protein [Clostridia bacterium]
MAEVKKNAPDVNDIEKLVFVPLTEDVIDRIPVATEDMTEEEKRAICVEFFRLQLTFPWTPNETFKGCKTSDGNAILEKGKVYGGNPYIACTWNSLYHFMMYYDEKTGVLDVASHRDNIQQLIGNQCAGGASWGWRRVTNSQTWRGTQEMTPHTGLIPLGPYSYDKDLKRWRDPAYGNVSTIDVCKENGEQTMYESYALLKTADGISTYSGSAGHVRMICKDAVVVRREDGTIDGDESYITFMHQQTRFFPRTQPDSTSYEIQGGVGTRRSFAITFEQGYLPFTLPELCGKKKIDKSHTTLSVGGEALSPKELKAGIVESNFSIATITLTVPGETEKAAPLYKKVIGVDLSEYFHYSYPIESLINEEELAPFAGKKAKIHVRIGTGEKPVVWSGILK